MRVAVLELAVVLLGWVGGLVVNYLADTLPATRRLGRPACTHCLASQDWGQYLLMRRCPACGWARRVRTWVVQIGFVAAYLWLWLEPPARLGFWIAAGLLVYLATVAVIDLEHRAVLHSLSWTGAVLGLLIGWRIHGLGVTLLGGALGYAIMWALYGFGKVFIGVVNRLRHQPVEEVALGFGDVNLSGVLGLLLGWPGIAAGLLLAILLGGIASAALLLIGLFTRRYQTFTAIAYAPFLVLAGIVLLYRP